MGNQQASAQSLPNDIEVAWTKDKSECPFQPLEGQTSTVIGSKIYLFGGVSADMAESDSLYIYDVISKEWSRKDRPAGGSGDVTWPLARSGAAMSSLGDQLYVFGGLSQVSGWLDDLLTYDTVREVWSALPATSGRPSPRDKATMSAAGGKLWLFGGFCPKIGEPECDVTPEVIADDGDESYEDIGDDGDVRRAQNAMTFAWSNELFCYHEGAWTKMSNKSDSSPTPRCAHAMATTTTNTESVMVYVLGGRDPEGRQKDLWCYDTALGKWSLVYCNGEHPAPASYLDMVAHGSNRLVAFGGRGVDEKHLDKLHVLDLDTCNWMQPTVTSVIKPPAMGMHHVCVVDDVIVVLGGSSGFRDGFCSVFHRAVYHLNGADVLRGGVVDLPEETPTEVEAKEEAATTNGVMTS